MLVGVCCTCEQGGKPLRYIRGRAIIDYHESFGSSCEGEGSAPQATYEIASGADQMPEGVQATIGRSFPIVKSSFPEHNVRSPDVYPDDLQWQRPEDQNAPDPECCSDPRRSTKRSEVDRETNVSRNHRPDPPKPPGIFGTIGDILRTASSKGTNKGTNKGKRKRA